MTLRIAENSDDDKVSGAIIPNLQILLEGKMKNIVVQQEDHDYL